MAKKELLLIADTLCKRHNLNPKDAEIFVNEFFTTINEGLKKDKLVKVKNLGTFKIQSVKARKSINVNTGEPIIIEQHEKITLTPDTFMKELINRPFNVFKPVEVNENSKLEVESHGNNNIYKKETKIEKIQIKENKQIPIKKEIESKNGNEPKEKKQSDEQIIENKKNKIWIFVTLIILLIIISIFGYNYWDNINTKNKKINQLEKLKAKDSKNHNINVKNKLSTKQKEIKKIDDNLYNNEKTTKGNKIEQLNSDKRLRYGAYNIVGTEKTIILKKGETMELYSRRTLGPDMLIYFQVLNGVDKMEEGDTLKIPKVKLKPEYRKHK